MTMTRLLTAALITSAMFIGQANAREHHVLPRHTTERVDTSAPQTSRYFDESYNSYCVPAPRVGAFATQPWDRAAPCEPMTGYEYGSW